MPRLNFIGEKENSSNRDHVSQALAHAAGSCFLRRRPRSPPPCRLIRPRARSDPLIRGPPRHPPTGLPLPPPFSGTTEHEPLPLDHLASGRDEYVLMLCCRESYFLTMFPCVSLRHCVSKLPGCRCCTMQEVIRR